MKAKHEKLNKLKSILSRKIQKSHFFSQLFWNFIADFQYFQIILQKKRKFDYFLT
jgi:hypothetical protein